MHEPMTREAERLAIIVRAIEKARRRFGPPADKVRLVAVSKTVAAEGIRPLLAAGQRLFGENRVQEAREKWPTLRTEFAAIELHLIGPLQSNKARDAVALFDCIQTLDRDKLAAALRVEMDRAGRQLPVYVQVNIGGEPQKSGIAPQEVAAFVARCRQQHGLLVDGLMCIPPEGVPPGPYFAQLAVLGSEAKVSHLSMGMSADFEVAIAMGATEVRIGTALFGGRAPPS